MALVSLIVMSARSSSDVMDERHKGSRLTSR